MCESAIVYTMQGFILWETMRLNVWIYINYAVCMCVIAFNYGGGVSTFEFHKEVEFTFFSPSYYKC